MVASEKLVWIFVSLGIPLASGQTTATVTCSDGNSTVTVTSPPAPFARCGTEGGSVNASGGPGGSPTQFTYNASVTGGIKGPVKAQRVTASVTWSFQLVLSGPPRPGYVTVISTAFNYGYGYAGAESSWALTGLPGLDDTSINHTFPITLEGGIFTGSITGDANNSDQDAPSFQAGVSVQLSFYEADGITPVPAAWQSPGLTFVPVTPCRILDTRNSTEAFGGSTLAAGETRAWAIPNGPCGIPSSAAAYSLNTTVVPKGTLNYLTLWPSDQPQPNVSTLNSLDGRIKASAAIVPASAGGIKSISAYVTDPTDVILDIDGYFAPATSTGLVFHPVTPCRLWDTRSPGDGPLEPSLHRSFAVAGNCGVPAATGASTDPQAYSLNITAIPWGPQLGYLTMFPAGSPLPLVSTLNAPTGTITANAAIVPAGLGGAISAFSTDTADLVLDLNGYFSTPDTTGTGLFFYPVTPSRVLDTRSSSGVFNGTLNVDVLGADTAVPAGAQTYVLNATVVPVGSLGWLSLWPAGVSMPLVSTLNAMDGWITSNLAIVPAGANGFVNAFASNNTDLILDLFGYFR